MSGPVNRRLVTAGLVALAVPIVVATAAGAAPAAACDDLLAVHGPGGSAGDTTAVTITSQTLERGTEGWASAAWHVADDTDLRAVIVVSDAGVTQLPGTARMVDGPARELHFCGVRTVAHATAADEERDERATPVGDRRPGGPQAAPSRAGATSPAAGSAAALSILGAGLGAAVSGLVLLLSRGNRDQREVLR